MAVVGPGFCCISESFRLDVYSPVLTFTILIEPSERPAAMNSHVSV